MRHRKSGGGAAGRVFGNPIDRAYWDLNSPFVLAKKNAAALLKMKIYFDCGTEDSYGFYRGASELHETLDALGGSPRVSPLPGAPQRLLRPGASRRLV